LEKSRVLLFAFCLLAMMVFSYAIGFLFEVGARELVATIVFFAVYGMMYILVVVFVRREQRGSVTDLGLQQGPETVSHLVIGTVSGAAAALLVYAFALVFGGQLRAIDEVTVDLILSQIIITIPVAVLEELAYRGYLLTRLSEIWGRSSGLVLSSLFFSVLHFGWWLPLGTVSADLILLFSVNLFLGGLVLGFSYYASGERLWVAIAFHFAWNIAAYVLFPIFPTQPVLMPEIFQIEWGWTTIPGFLFGLSLVWSLMRINRSQRPVVKKKVRRGGQ